MTEIPEIGSEIYFISELRKDWWSIAKCKILGICGDDSINCILALEHNACKGLGIKTDVAGSHFIYRVPMLECFKTQAEAINAAMKKFTDLQNKL